MLVVGLGQQAAADYLDKEYTRANAVHDARGSQTRLERRSAASSLFDPLIDQYANLHKVEAAIVRAICPRRNCLVWRDARLRATSAVAFPDGALTTASNSSARTGPPV